MPTDQFGTQYAWMFLTPNNPMCEHKLSINVCFKCKCRLAEDCSCEGSWRVEMTCHGLFHEQNTPVPVCGSVSNLTLRTFPTFWAFIQKGWWVNLACAVSIRDPAREATHSQITVLFMWEMHTGLLVENYTLIFHLYWMGHWAFSQLGVQDWKKWWVIACRHVFFFL